MKFNLIFAVCIALTSVQSQAQLPKDDEGEVTFSGVVEVENLSRMDIYDKAKLWMVSTLKSGDNMVELDGDGSDRIVGTGNIQLEDIETINKWWKTKETFINFKFIIHCKDNKYKFEVTNFTLKYAYLREGLPYTVASRLEEIEVPEFMNKKKFDKEASEFRSNASNQIIDNITYLINDLKKTMSQEEEDW